MEVIYNGKNIKTKAKNISDFKKEQNIQSDINIVDGFTTDENLSLYEGVNLAFIRRGEMPEKDVLKSMIEARNSPELNLALKNACIGIAGLGGLGSNIALSLARVGIARLVVADFDIVEPSNLNRQQYFIKHIGMKKCDAIKELIYDANPFVDVKTWDVKLDSKNMAGVFKDCSIVCEAFDKAEYKSMIVNEASRSLKDKIIIIGSGMSGYHSSNTIKTIKYANNVYICGDLISEAKIKMGLMAPRVGICANHEANLVLRLLMNEGI